MSTLEAILSIPGLAPTLASFLDDETTAWELVRLNRPLSHVFRAQHGQMGTTRNHEGFHEHHMTLLARASVTRVDICLKLLTMRLIFSFTELQYLLR
jgi:hypothetical protein